MLGTYYGQTYLGRGYPIIRFVLFLSDTQDITDNEPAFSIVACLEDNLQLLDQFPVAVWRAGLGANYIGMTHIGGALPMTVQIKNIAFHQTFPLSDTLQMEDFLGTQWQAYLALQDNLPLADSVLANVFAAITDIRLPSVSPVEVKPATSTEERVLQ